MTEPRRRKQLVTKQITVPGNLQRACDDFNSGKFYESHEHIEEIWQYERGVVRDAYKGLIQIAAGFVHLSRGKYAGSERLLRTAMSYLQPYRASGALGFDIERICAEAQDIYDRVLAAGPAGTGSIDVSRRPYYTFATERLRQDAIRDSAWGFDAAGNALIMEIRIAQ